MTNKSPSRSCDEINDAILSAAEVKAIAIGDPRIAEKFAVDNEISKLKIVRANYLREMSRVNDIIENGPARIERITNAIANNKDTIEKLVGGTFVINGQVYNRDSEAINAMIAYMTEVNHNYDLMYAGLDVELKKINNEVVKVEFCGHVLHDSFDYYTPRKLVNRLLSFSESLSNTIIDQERRLEEWKKSYSESLTMANKPFAQQEELDRLLAKQAELALALEFHENGNEEQIGHTA